MQHEPTVHRRPMSTGLTRVLRWATTHRPVVASVAAVVWTGVMLVFVDAFWIAAVCGIAFGIVLARTLAEPSHDGRD